MDLKYRPDIDGLRAVAVLAVVVYHATFSFSGGDVLTGGYLGVDVFFVISGFLITSILLVEQRDTGHISIANFYKRRVRRLLPALLLVVVVTLPLAYMFLLPEQMIDYAGSLVGSLLFSSNFYWYFSLQQYGAESALLKPFLHTWSLAVEEQYYLLYPLLLMLIGKRSRALLFWVFLMLALASLFFAQYMTVKDSSFSFYLLPSRLWELMAGGFCALYYLSSKKLVLNRLVSQIILLSSVAVLIACMVVFRKETHHPGFITLMPIIATMAIISFGDEDSIVTQCLSFRPVVAIGKLSYAIYLWHFPIFAFARISGNFETPAAKLGFLVLAVLASAVSYKFVETPFRRKTKVSWPKTIAATGVTSVAVLLLSGFAIIKQGFPERYTDVLDLTAEEMAHYRSDYWSDHSRFLPYTQPFSDDKISVEVIGNSYGLDVSNVLAFDRRFEVHFEGMTGYRCNAFTQPLSYAGTKDHESEIESCGKNAERFVSISPGADIVILADSVSWVNQYANSAVLRAFEANIAAIRTSFDGPIIVIKNRPVWNDDGFRIISDFGSVGELVNQESQDKLAQPVAELLLEDEYYQNFFAQRGVHYISLAPMLCPDGECKLVKNGKAMFFDRNHITLDGARFISEDLVNEVLAIYDAGGSD